MLTQVFLGAAKGRRALEMDLGHSIGYRPRGDIHPYVHMAATEHVDTWP